MTETIHERPGVYSSFDASGVASTAQGTKVVGLAAKAAVPAEGVVLLHSPAEGLSVFGADGDGAPGMAALLRLLFANGAGAVAAVSVAQEEDYAAAFALLEAREDVKLVVCGSETLSVQQALRASVLRASQERRERIAVVGSTGESVEELTARAQALDCERVVLVGGDGAPAGAEEGSGLLSAAAVAGLLAAQSDPALPIQGAALQGLAAVGARYSDSEIDTLVRGGVTPLEESGGIVSPVRGVTTRTKSGDAQDATWRELTTVLIVDDVIPAIRSALRSRFARSKNTAQSRGAIRAQVVLELENRRALERIESYGEVSVRAMDGEPTVCLVEFSFAVVHGLSRIYLTAHITV